MKPNQTSKILLILITGFLFQKAPAQLNNGGFHAGFGVDADTKSGYIKYGALAGTRVSDDWFSLAGNRTGVIDTAHASKYRNLLAQNKNISFSQRMSAPLFHKAGNNIWLDAVYSRDYINMGNFGADSTAFLTAAKNAQDPAVWSGGPTSVSNKNDIVDVFTHMRRSGNTIQDSLWLFTAASMVGTTGSKYYDVELYKNHVGFNPATGTFNSGGPDEGHTSWKFDATGNIIQSGDLIIAITYNPGSAPVVEVRIWVSKNTHATLIPSLFNFNADFDAASNGSLYGYASISSKTGTTAFGSGAGNYSFTATDTTYSTPWGTTGTAWTQNYQSLQLVEVGLNLTRIGIDPGLYSALGTSASCGSFFKSIFYKSRSSASFSSALNDFVGPLDFMRIPVLDHSLTTDTLTCHQSTGFLRVTTNSTSGQYTWTTTNGQITAINQDSTICTISAPGQYILLASVAAGCATGRTDTIMVLSDSLKPVATANVALHNTGQAQLYGGDPVASNYPSLFGGSLGLSYSWTGPNNFTSIQQNPVVSEWGVYEITVTELRNGCTSVARVVADFTYLAAGEFKLKANPMAQGTELIWSSSFTDITSFEIERAVNGGAFVKIGTIPATVRGREYSFIDLHPVQSSYLYRIKQLTKNGTSNYSNTISALQTTTRKSIYLSRTGSNALTLNVQVETTATGNILMYDMGGRQVSSQPVKIMKGSNIFNIQLPDALKNKPVILYFTANNKLLFTQKIIL